MGVVSGQYEIVKLVKKFDENIQIMYTNKLDKSVGQRKVGAFLKAQESKSQLNDQLFKAISTRNVNGVSDLLHRGADSNAVTEKCGVYFGAPALVCAACVQSIEIVQILLDDNSTQVNKPDLGYNGTALIWASRSGNLPIVRALLGKGAEINKQTITKDTALTMTAHYGHLDVARYLVDQGADTNHYQILGKTAKEMALLAGHVEVAEYLNTLSNSVVSNTFFEAVANGNVTEVRRNLRNGVNVNSRTATCCTYREAPAIICAACSQQPAVVELLLQESASVDLEDLGDGGTALIWAARAGSLEIIRTLLQAGADVNAATQSAGDTPLIWAARNGHLAVVRFLVESGANISTRTKNGQTALGLASINGQYEVVRYLESTII